MTNQQISDKFDIDYDAVALHTAPPMTPGEKSALCNQAMDELVMQFNYAKNYDAIKELYTVEKFDLMVCAVEELGDFAFQTNQVPKSEFMYYVDSRVKLSRSHVVVVDDKWVGCQLIGKVLGTKFVTSPMNSPVIIYPKVVLHYYQRPFTDTDESGNPPPGWIDPSTVFPIVLVDKYTTFSTTENCYELTYIKFARRIDIEGAPTAECELHKSFHQTIINQAVRLAIKANDPGRVPQQQQSQQQQQEQE